MVTVADGAGHELKRRQWSPSVAYDLDMSTMAVLMDGFHQRMDILTITSGQLNARHCARETPSVVEQDEVI